jgi:hypothetical protein
MPTLLEADIMYDMDRFESRKIPDEVTKQIPKALAKEVSCRAKLKADTVYTDVCETANGRWTVFYCYYPEGRKIGIIRVNRRK